jgi:radical SAM superfamily enzyme YgiQ (UPF0313 family)
MYAICDNIIRRNIDIRIACPTGIHINTLDKPLLKKMKQAGFYRLCFGIETGNQEMQKRIHKNIDLEKAKRVIKDANDLGFWTSATFIVGFPGEGYRYIGDYDHTKPMYDTLTFPSYADLDFPIFYQWTPQPKTELWNEIAEKKLPCYAPNQLQPLLNWGYKGFIKYKLLMFFITIPNLLKKIRSLEDLKYTLRLIIFALTHFVFRRSINNENILGR